MAIRRARGNVSFNKASRLALSSVFRNDWPVMLSAGLARLAGEARADRVPGCRDDDRDRRAGPPDRANRNPGRHHDLGLERHQLGGDPRKQVGPPLSALHDELDVLTLDIPELVQTLAERGEQARHAIVQDAHEGDLVRRLRLHRERRGDETASDHAKEGPSLHSIT
jgi:hypothetical protein